MSNKTNNNRECERKFLVTDDTYKTLASTHFFIRQGYLCKDSQRSVRVRLSRDKTFLTIKANLGTSRMTHFEWEKEIDIADGMALLQLCLPELIEKTRWIVPVEDGLKWEIDEFEGRLKGLVVAEIELEDERQTFSLPPFIGREVTEDERYYNVNL